MKRLFTKLDCRYLFYFILRGGIIPYQEIYVALCYEVRSTGLKQPLPMKTIVNSKGKKQSKTAFPTLLLKLVLSLIMSICSVCFVLITVHAYQSVLVLRSVTAHMRCQSK